MRRKIFLVLLAVMLILSSQLFANGSKESTASDGTSGTVTMWTFPVTGTDEAMFKELVAEFNKIYPDITVDVQVLPWNGRYEKMLTAVAGGNPPNIVYLNDFQVPLFAATDNLVDMGEVYSEEELSTWKESALNSVSYDGELYGIPVLTNHLGYFYNVDLFVDAGLDPDNPPQTWSELKDAIKKLTKYDESGNVVQWGARFDLNRPSPITSIVPFIWQAGGDILDADGNVIVDSAETREALSFIKSLYDEGYVQKSNITGGGIPFSSGEIGIELQKEPNEIKKYSDENPDLNFRVGPILENKEKVGYITSGCYAMFSGAKNNEAAITWLKFITNNDNITRLLSDSGFMSPKSDINESDYMTDDRYLMIASQSEWATGTGPMNIHYSEILTACGQTFNAIILGEKDMDQGLAELKAQLEQIMAE